MPARDAAYERSELHGAQTRRFTGKSHRNGHAPTRTVALSSQQKSGLKDGQQELSSLYG